VQSVRFTTPKRRRFNPCLIPQGITASNRRSRRSEAGHLRFPLQRRQWTSLIIAGPAGAAPALAKLQNDYALAARNITTSAVRTFDGAAAHDRGRTLGQ